MDFFELSSYRTRKNILSDIKKEKNRKLVIFGSGQIGRETARLMLLNEIVPDYFVETKDYCYPNKTVEVCGNAIPCIDIEQIENLEEGYNLLCGVIDYTKVEWCKRIFRKAHRIDYLDSHPQHFISKEFLEQNRDSINEIYNILQDEESKSVLEAFLHARYTGDVKRISELMHRESQLYDWELLNLSEEDILVEGGAYDGDTIIELWNSCGIMPKVIAFEPDKNNAARLVKNIDQYVWKDLITVVEAGLSDRDQKLKFVNNGTVNASFDEEGTVEIPVQALDCHVEYENVTAIKMDIEGSEVSALFGAKQLIKENHPKLAICIYHNNSDLIEIYRFLKEYNYKLYLRQHSHSSEETVLYAL